MSRYGVIKVKEWKKRVGIALGILMICISCIFNGETTSAAEPKVMLHTYHLSQELVMPGEDVTLTIEFLNTARSSIKNMKIILREDEHKIIPVNSAGTQYLSEIKKGEVAEINLDLHVDHSAEGKNYPVAITCEYEGTDGMQYTTQERIYITVHKAASGAIRKMMVSNEVTEGCCFEFVADVVNSGDVPFYQGELSIQGQDIEGQKIELGDFKAGEILNLDLSIRAIRESAQGSSSQGYVILTYQDELGKEHTVRQGFQIRIKGVNYTDLTMLKEENKHKVPIWPIAGALLVGIIAFGVFWYYRERKQRENTFWDDQEGK